MSGGTLAWAAFAEPSSLATASTIAAISTGGMEMLNIYDSLMRYDAEIQEFVNQDVPFLVLTPFAKVVTWADDVHEVVGTSNGMVTSGNTWKD